MTYSPYDNVESKNYPHTLITTGYWDSQVQYWEPAKWLAKLRENKTDDNIIKGCQSKVWLHAQENDGFVEFSADSDAIITKGIVAILIRVLSNQTAEEIAKADLVFIDKIGFKKQLSQTRANGLVSMIKKIKLYALAYQNN